MREAKLRQWVISLGTGSSLLDYVVGPENKDDSEVVAAGSP